MQDKILLRSTYDDEPLFFNRLLRSKPGKVVALVAAAMAVTSACSSTTETNESTTSTTGVIGETFENGPIMISTSLETMYDSLPTSTDPEIWAQQVFGVLSVAYNENREDLLAYVFGGEFKQDSYRRQGDLMDSIAERKLDPSRLDSYRLGVELIPDRTDFDGANGVISVRSYRTFKFVDGVAVVDLTVGRHTVDVLLPDGSVIAKELLLIEFWDTVSENITN